VSTFDAGVAWEAYYHGNLKLVQELLGLTRMVIFLCHCESRVCGTKQSETGPRLPDCPSRYCHSDEYTAGRDYTPARQSCPDGNWHEILFL